MLRDLSDRWPLPSDVADTELVARAYARYGDTFVERVTGDFALAVIDRSTNRVLLARDRVGVRPLCYARRGDALLFASSPGQLVSAGIPAVPDELTIADHFLYFLAADGLTRTFFAGIQSLPPAHVLVANAGREPTVRRYFDFDTTRPVRLRTVADYAAAFHDVAVASVRKRLRGTAPVAVSVSGGLDSSYIFCIAQRLIRDEPGLCPSVHGINYGGPSGTLADESAFVRAIEDACGVTIERIPHGSGFLASATAEVRHAESPIAEGLATVRQSALSRAREAHASRFLTGHWGDQVLSDSRYLEDLLSARRWRLLGQHARAWRVGTGSIAASAAWTRLERCAPSVVTAAVRLARRRNGPQAALWFTPRFRHVLRERFAAARLPAIAGTSHASGIYRQVRAPYYVHCMEWNARIGAMHGLQLAFPFLDADLVQFLMSIPGEMQSPDGVPRGLLRLAMRAVVPAAIVERRSKGEFTPLSNQRIAEDFDTIAGLLGPDALSVRYGIVDPRPLQCRLPEWRARLGNGDDAVAANRVLELCGLELLLRSFFPAVSGVPS